MTEINKDFINNFVDHLTFAKTGLDKDVATLIAEASYDLGATALKNLLPYTPKAKEKIIDSLQRSNSDSTTISEAKDFITKLENPNTLVQFSSNVLHLVSMQATEGQSPRNSMRTFAQYIN